MLTHAIFVAENSLILKLERRVKKRTEASNQGMVSLNTVTPNHGGHGYQYNEFKIRLSFMCHQILM
jgi:hypothetical protein